MAVGYRTIPTVKFFEHSVDRRNKSYLEKKNEARELLSRMYPDIRPVLIGTGRLDNSCGIGGIPAKSKLPKTEVKSHPKSDSI